MPNMVIWSETIELKIFGKFVTSYLLLTNWTNHIERGNVFTPFTQFFGFDNLIREIGRSENADIERRQYFVLIEKGYKIFSFNYNFKVE